jgi:hypothetical protein
MSFIPSSGVRGDYRSNPQKQPGKIAMLFWIARDAILAWPRAALATRARAKCRARAVKA